MLAMRYQRRERQRKEMRRIVSIRPDFGCRDHGPDATMPPPAKSLAIGQPKGRRDFIRGRGATGLTPATGMNTDQKPEHKTAPDTAADTARSNVSSKFIRREAALAAEDAEHAKVVAERFSLLRTRILREMRNRGWTRLAVVPVKSGAGGTYTAVNLSLALARQPHTQVTLIDLDLGDPAVAKQLAVPGCDMVSAVLRDRQGLDQLVVTVSEAPNLSVLAPGHAEPAAAELLQDQLFIDAMAKLHESHPAEIAILNTAALLGQDAALAALPLADAILLVADGRRGTAADMAECERLLAGMPPVMGVVLNKSDD